MARTSTSKAFSSYNKEELIASLKEARARVTAMVITFDQAMAKWREEAPVKFSKAVKEYDPTKNQYWGGRYDFEPPKREAICADWRVKGLDKTIARIGLIDGPVVKLRADDEIWQWIGMGPCEEEA